MLRDPFTAIAHPARREIIALLARDPKTVNELSDHFPMSRTAVSKHLKILKECGLLDTKQEGREKYCLIKLHSLEEVATWVKKYKMFWNDRLDTLETLLKQDSQSKK